MQAPCKLFNIYKRFPFSSILLLNSNVNPAKDYVRLLTTSNSDKINENPEKRLELSSISELIAKQHWREVKLVIKERDPSEILQQLMDSETDPLVIIQYFRWSEREVGVLHSVDMYCKLFHLLGNGGLYGQIRKLLNGFVKNGKYSNSEIFHRLSLFGESFRANSVLVDMLVVAYVNNSEVGLALEAAKRAWDYGFRLSALSCNPLLSALVDQGRIKDMEDVFKGMIRKRIRPDLITFNTVISGFCKVGQLQKAGDRLEDIKAWGFSPTVVTYNALINGYCKKGRVGKMYKFDVLLREMVSMKICPNEIILLLMGFVRIKTCLLSRV